MKLEPCPFCGSVASHSEPPPVINGVQHGGSVGCAALFGCYAPRFLYDPRQGPDAVVAAWNMRAGGAP